MRSVAFAIGGLFVMSAAASSTQQAAVDPWVSTFDVDRRDLASTGRNPYFILEPGYQLVLERAPERLVITVLDETKTVDGVETRVVEERETERDRIVEVSRNYFVINRRTSDVFYFGEDVDVYKNGVVAGHEGAWLAGVGGARYGLMMPGSPRVGARYYQELAPRVAMDRARIVSVTASVRTPLGTMTDCLQIEETTPLEPGARETKAYARGIGLIQDAALRLVRHGSR
jgi:hypothetical protein